MKMKQYESIDVYCTCRLPDDGCPMVCCVHCGEWFHQSYANFWDTLIFAIEQDFCDFKDCLLMEFNLLNGVIREV